MKMKPISELIAGGSDGEAIIDAVFSGVDYEMFDDVIEEIKKKKSK